MGVGQAAHAGTLERCIEAQPEYVTRNRARDVDPRVDAAAADTVVLAADAHGLDEYLGFETRAPARAEVEGGEIDGVSSLRQLPSQVNPLRG
jgi:hypothetical protein